MSSDEDEPRLSAATLAALQEFYSENSKQEEILAQCETDDDLKENIVFGEDWQLSQFWYNEETIITIVQVVQKNLPIGGNVALIACPTLYLPIRKALDLESSVKLLEFDTRFRVYGENFIQYDFNEPQKIPIECLQKFDIVIADPPFLSEECLTKTSETIKLLAKNKIVLCTGSIMCDHAKRLLDLNVCNFKPQHKNNLANEFSCFSNFDLDNAVR